MDNGTDSNVAVMEKKTRKPGMWVVMRENQDGSWDMETGTEGILAASRKEAMRQIYDANGGEGRLWAFRATEFQPKARKAVETVTKEVWE